jgi:ferric-dicitrate binding protein FerR (iron transport regulator)
MTTASREQAQFLLARYVKADTSPEEEMQLFQLINREDDSPAWEEMLEELMVMQEPDIAYDRQRWQIIIEKVIQSEWPVRRKVLHMRRWSMTAAILIVLGIAGWWLFRNENQIAPPHLVKLYDTAFTASGKTLALTLPDGSKVWLNARSTLRYPIAFNGQQRRVELIGEAYFEVAKNTAQPFIVDLPAGESAAGGAVEVVGTHFNIQSYRNEPAITATVLEGSIKLSPQSQIQNPQSKILHAGQQATLQPSGNITLKTPPDTASVMAWKEGFFEFEGTIEIFMRELERWYDITVVYEKGIPDQRIAGRLSRNMKLSEMIEALRNVLDADLRLEGTTLIVSPK